MSGDITVLWVNCNMGFPALNFKSNFFKVIKSVFVYLF